MADRSALVIEVRRAFTTLKAAPYGGADVTVSCMVCEIC